MNKLVMAALLATATLTGTQGSASAFQLPGFSLVQPKMAKTAEPEARVHLAQSSDPSVRVQQLEEEIRSLNGRIEEMSFQLLQMQETIRKAQEDNEFRFQDLENGGTKKSGSLERPVDGGNGSDSVAEIITQTPDVGAAADTSGSAQPEQQLGSIDLDTNGLPVDTTINPDAVDNSASLPGVDTATAPATQQAPAVSETAASGSENDIYQVAYAHVLSGDYGLAENEFRDFISSYPSSKKIADANFWLGEALYSQGNFNEAAKTFLNAHQTYSSSPKAPEMLLKLGMSLAALDNTETACATLREVPKRYPKASRAVVSKVASEQKRLSC